MINRLTYFLCALVWILFSSAVSSIANCGPSLWPRGTSTEIHLAFNDLDNQLHSVVIHWVRPHSDLDSFYIVSEREGHPLFTLVRSPQGILLLMGPERIPRLLAPHHLRERLLNGPLRWEDFQLLAHPKLSCDTTRQRNPQVHSFRPHQTQLWSTLQYPSQGMPDSLQFLGWRREWHRTLYIHKWIRHSTMGWLPQSLELSAGDLRAKIRMLPPQSLAKGPQYSPAVRDTIFNKPWRPMQF